MIDAQDRRGLPASARGRVAVQSRNRFELICEVPVFDTTAAQLPGLLQRSSGELRSWAVISGMQRPEGGGELLV
jgi:hypothetical protein